MVGREGMGGGNEKSGTDHVISGPVRGLEKKCMENGLQTHTQTDIATI